jgi:subtilisin family serine protease
MHKKITSLALAGFALSLTAQTNLDLGSQAMLRRIRLENQAGENSPVRVPLKANSANTPLQQNSVLALMRVADGTTSDLLEQNDIKLLRMRGNIAIVSIDVDKVEQVANLQFVKRLQLSKEQFAKLDLARSASGIDAIHSGSEGLPQAYTGKGVVAGIVDSGIDVHHINFKDEDGNSRIKQLTYVRANAAGTDQITSYYFPDDPDYDLAYFITDSNESFHGSHTLGIMGGGYRGDITYPVLHDDHTAELVTAQNPYHGVAYDSDLVVSCGTLGDGYIAYGIEYILDYAYAHNQPAVINLSLGSNTGGHDGTEMMNEYLNLAGQEAIICVSAGNEGDHGVALHKDLTEGDTELKSFFEPFYFGKSDYEDTSYYKLNYGAMYFYSDTEENFEIQAIIYNKRRNRIAQRFVVPTNATTGTATYYISSSDYQQTSDDVVTKSLGNYFDGYLGLGCAYDSGSGRYYALIDLYLTPNQETNADDNYLVGFVITGKNGQRIDCYSDATATCFNSYDIEGWMDGTADGSINSMACGNNIVVVGSYNTRDSFGSLMGVEVGFSDHYYPGEISEYSSYGRLNDGRQLPHVCAPGATIISSTNNAYIEANTLVDPESLQGVVEGTDRNYYWEASAGTSMATPVVAGSIALWLEADPTLTVDEVLDIIEQTADKDESVNDENVDPVKWGAGKFNALAGLKAVMRNSGISGAVADRDNRLLTTALGNNSYNVCLAGEKALDIKVYDLSGKTAMQLNILGDETNLNLSGLSTGVYILNVNGRCSQKVIVK